MSKDSNFGRKHYRFFGSSTWQIYRLVILQKFKCYEKNPLCLQHHFAYFINLNCILLKMLQINSTIHET